MGHTTIMSNLRLVTPPTVEPISLEEARQHLRLIPEGSPLAHADDALVTGLISAARQHLDGKDGWLGRQLITATWELVLDRFPDHEIRVPLPPLQTVSAIYYDDLNGDQQEVSSADYQVDAVSEPGWIVPVSGVAWPATIEGINAVRVRFVAGYGVAGNTLPVPILQAMKLLLAHWYSHREPVMVGSTALPIPFSVESLLSPYRVWSFL